ncbi:hypothetical protein K8R32_03070 [bacterium]|nr:hypothetical protein [bacterium]
MAIDYLKIGKADELSGADQRLYRIFEIIPGFLSWTTLLSLTILSYFKPTAVAYFIIAFDVYWLLLVIFLGIHLVVSYSRMKKGIKTDWEKLCCELEPRKLESGGGLIGWEDVVHLVIFPIAFESYEVIRESVKKIAMGKYPTDKMILLLTVEERGGAEVKRSAEKVRKEFAEKFKFFYLTFHPEGIVGEIKGKGSNQAWGAKELKKIYLDKADIDSSRIMTSVFDIDTVI